LANKAGWHICTKGTRVPATIKRRKSERGGTNKKGWVLSVVNRDPLRETAPWLSRKPKGEGSGKGRTAPGKEKPKPAERKWMLQCSAPILKPGRQHKTPTKKKTKKTTPEIGLSDMSLKGECAAGGVGVERPLCDKLGDEEGQIQHTPGAKDAKRTSGEKSTWSDWVLKNVGK